MCTYLKNMEGNKPKDLKNKSFVSIQKMFDKAFKRVNTFVDFRANLVEVDDDQEAIKIKELMEIDLDEEEVAINVIPLAAKPPSIVDWKIHKEGKKSYYQMSQIYLVFSHMLKNFDREDLETLWKLVKAKHGSIRPEEGYERVLLGNLKVMFEPHVEDIVWRNQQDYRVLEWKLYDSCGVHFLRMQHMQIYMLVENKYHLTPATITDMLNKKLQCDHFSEMAYQLLKSMTKQCKVNAAEGVNAASEEVSTDKVVELTSLPNQGICLYSNAWSLDQLETTLVKAPPYNSSLPSLEDIRDRIHRRLTFKKQTKHGIVQKLPNQIKTHELLDHLKPCELVIRENTYVAIGNRDHVQGSTALMLYYLENLKATKEDHPFDERYIFVARKMSSLKAKQPKRPAPKKPRNVERGDGVISTKRRRRGLFGDRVWISAMAS
ncbi:hypothetical protein Tco_0864129 [Tanacetum coccineum]